MDSLARRLEALICIASRPLPVAELALHCDRSEDAVRAALGELEAEYVTGRHGLEVVTVAGGVTFRVADECEAAVRSLAGARQPDDLSPALLETLAVVAYLQPATRSEVAQVRGVSSEWALSGLEERGLVEVAGRAETPGAPILYRTTDRFLRLFGLENTDGLPALGNFALEAGDVEEIRAHLMSNAARRST
jgi:segregation and condensation protein B